jgi:hypothetical protein
MGRGRRERLNRLARRERGGRLDLRRSLEEVEGERWGDPPPEATRLVSTIHAVRRKPLESLDAEDLRITIGQQVGLRVLVPIALDLLEHDPLAEGDLYPGALLAAVLRVPAEYWDARPEQSERLEGVAVRALEPPEDPDREGRDVFGPYVDAFRAARTTLT